MPRSRLAFLLLAIVPLLCRAASTSQPAGPVFNIVDLAHRRRHDTRHGGLSQGHRSRALRRRRSRSRSGREIPHCSAPVRQQYDAPDRLGITIVFTQNPNEYPLVDSRWEGVMTRGHQPCLWARDCHDIAIAGAGTIDGQGASWWAAQVRGPTTNPALQSPITDATGARSEQCRRRQPKAPAAVPDPRLHQRPHRRGNLHELSVLDAPSPLQR